MAFLGSLSKPVQYNPNSSGNFYARSVDRLVEVTGYDTARGYIYTKDSKGKEYEVYVNPQVVLDQNEYVRKNLEKYSSVPWMGHSIDARMEKNIPIGNKVILVQSKIIKVDKVRNLTVLEVQRIGGVPNPEEDKTFEGIMTVTARRVDNAVVVDRIQAWDERGIDINSSDELRQLADRMDESSARYRTMIGDHYVTLPTIGVQFRALLKTDREYSYGEEGKKTIYEVVNTSFPFEWIPGPLDEDGNEIKDQAHVITGDEMLELAEKYVEYISNHDDYRDLIDDMRVEVCVYRSFPASHASSMVIIPSAATDDPERMQRIRRSPLYVLSHRESYIDSAQTVKIIGKTMAVIGILQVSGDKLVKVDGVPTEIPTNWANRFHYNNYRGHVHAFVRTSDGYKTEPHQNLRLLELNAPSNTEQVEVAHTHNQHISSAEDEYFNSNESFDSSTSLDDNPFAGIGVSEEHDHRSRGGNRGAENPSQNGFNNQNYGEDHPDDDMGSFWSDTVPTKRKVPNFGNRN